MVSEVPTGIEPVQFYADHYKSYKRRNKLNIARENRNWGIFSGVNFKQWDAKQLQVLLDEARAPHQVNFLQKQIISLAGNFYQNEFETDYEPNVGAPNDDTILLKSIFLTDSNRGGWKKARRKLIRGGLVYRGTVEMFIDYKTDRRGSVGLRYVPHTRMLYDPDWSTDEVVDNKHIKQFAWMTPDEIKRRYKTKSAEVDQAVELYKQAQSQITDEFSNPDQIDQARNSYYDDSEFLNIVDGRFLVIQDSRLERGFSEQMIDKKTGDVLPEMSEANTQSMMALRGESLKVVEDEFAKLRINTIVPGLSKTLMLQDDEMHKMQTGTYQYHAWSALNIDGEVQGVVDVMKDLQEIYNKRESTYTHAQTTAANGAEFVEEDFFANDEEFSKYVRGKNKPGQTYKVQPNKLSGSKMGIATRPRNDLPGDMHVSADRAFNMTPEVGYAVPPLTGGEGKSGESSRLFRDKKAQALVSLDPMTKTLQDFENSIGESYFYLVKPVYGTAPRVLTNQKTKENLFLNIPTEGGEIKNNVNEIRRHSVIITTSRNGESTRSEILDRYVEINEKITNPVYKAIIEKNLISYVPNIPDSEIKTAEAAADKYILLLDSRMDSEIAQNNFGMAKFDKDTQNLLSPPGPSAPGKTPAEGGGISVEGQNTQVGAGVPADVNNVNQLR